MPKGSRATKSDRSTVSQMAKANMPRSRRTAAGPQWWKATMIGSPSPSVSKVAPNSRRSSSRSSR